MVAVSHDLITALRAGQEWDPASNKWKIWQYWAICWYGHTQLETESSAKVSTMMPIHRASTGTEFVIPVNIPEGKDCGLKPFLFPSRGHTEVTRLILLLMNNYSYDNYLDSFPGPGHWPGISSQPLTPTAPHGRKYFLRPHRPVMRVKWDKDEKVLLKKTSNVWLYFSPLPASGPVISKTS